MGSRSFKRDLADLDWEQFERLVHRLIVREWPTAERLAPPDGGADTIVAVGADGLPHVFQAKHYPITIHWAHCVGSLDTALREHSPGRITFVFPKNLTHAQRRAFNEKLATPARPVALDYWGLEELDIRLRGAPEVVDEFFGPDAQDLTTKVMRAAEQGLRISSTADLIARQGDAVHFLDGRDARFRHQHVSGDRSLPAPRWDEPPYVILEAGAVAGPGTKIAAWPRPGTQAPLPAFSFLPGEAGMRARAKARAAWSAGQPVELSEGLRLDIVAPQILRDALEDGSQSGDGVFVLQPSDPVSVELVVREGETITRRVGEVRSVPARSSDIDPATSLLGMVEGLSIEIELVIDEGQVSGSVHVGPRFGRVAEQNLAAAEFIEAWLRAGQMEVMVGDAKPLLVRSGSQWEPGALAALVEMMRAVIVLEKHLGRAIDVPASMGRTEAELVLVAAHLASGEVAEMTLDASLRDGPPEVPLGRGRSAFSLNALGERITFDRVDWVSSLGMREPLSIETGPVPVTHLRMKVVE